MPSGPTRATVLLDDGPVTILPKRAPVGNSGPIRGHTLTIVPGTPPPASLDSGRPHFSSTIEPGAQPAYALLDLDEGDAAALGRSLGLVEILFWDGRRAQLLPCDGS